MRYELAAVCALMMLSGCGRNPQEPPQAAIQPGRDETGSRKKGDTPAPGKQENPASKNATNPAAKQDGPARSAAAGFDPEDPQRTLHWLVANLAKVRATQEGDREAADRAWEQYAGTLKAAAKQKIHWTLAVETVTDQGIVTETLKSAEDTACQGLRLKPDQQPAGFTTFILQWPAAARGANVRAGDRVTVTGVVERIETEPGKSRPHARPYGFNVRLSDYRISPAN